jgi:hypothetical protein
MICNRLFISGIPASGKSYLANMLAEKLDGIHIAVDDIRKNLVSDPRYSKWVNFYLDQDEKDYYTNTNASDQWANLVNQSEAIWPAILEKIKGYKNESRHVIFEGVNILPHLAKRDLTFPGVVLTGESFEDIFERNKKDPRWGATIELQKMEAESFWNIERPRYKAEAEKYGYTTFDSAQIAFKYLIK